MLFFLLGSLFGFVAVAFGAFGAHALKATLSIEMMAVFETSVRYQMYHSFALFVAGWASQKYSGIPFAVAGWSFILGILLFSGSLYLLALTGIRWFGAITPFGGLAFLAGWLALVFGFWKVSQ